MSDIPPGYYSDPERPGKIRRWTGTAWEPIVDRRRALIVGLVAAGLWLVALFLPVYPVDGPEASDGDALPGLVCAVFGAFFGAGALIAWSGQFLTTLVALIGVLRRRESWLLRLLPLVVGVAAIVVAATMIGMEVPGDEGGVTHDRITGLEIGFYVWAASVLLAALTPWTVRREKKWSRPEAGHGAPQVLCWLRTSE